MGKNWNSKEKIFTEIKGEKAIYNAKVARELRANGVNVTEISKRLNISKSRVYEYLK
jgi:predicted transcriptional regulator